MSFMFWNCVSFLQLTGVLSCLSPQLFELPKKLFGTVHDTTKESLRNLQPYCVLRMKCSLSHDSSIAYGQVTVDGDILRYTNRVHLFQMVMFVLACTVIILSQEQYEPKCKVNCKTTKSCPVPVSLKVKVKSLCLIKCCLMKMCEGVEVA